MTRAWRDERSRQRRAEVLALRLHGYLDRPGHYPMAPVAVGVGPDDIAAAALAVAAARQGVVITSHDGNGS
jgi:hypothetical protein